MKNTIIYASTIIILIKECFAVSSNCNTSTWPKDQKEYACSGVSLNDNNETESKQVLSMKIPTSLLKKNSVILKTEFDCFTAEQETIVDILTYWGNSESSVWSYYSNDKRNEMSMRIDIPNKQKFDSGPKDEELKVSLMPRSLLPISANVSLELQPNVLEFEKDINGTLRSNFPLVYRYYNSDMEGKRVRVFTTRRGLTTRKMARGCSFVSIQKLDKRINEKESDVTFESLWQTMLGQSVIDVDVGPNRVFKDGFNIVILRRKNDHCADSRYDARIDSRVDLENGNNHMINQTNEKENDIQFNIKVIKISDDVGTTTWIIVIILISIVATLIIWESTIGAKYVQFSLTGKVHGNQEIIESRNHQLIDSDDDDDKVLMDRLNGVRIQIHSDNDRKSILTIDEKQKYSLIKKSLSTVERINHKINAIGTRCQKARRNDQLTMADLSTKLDPTLFLHSVRMKSGLYSWIVVMSGIFYLLPAIQLMLGAQLIAKETGSQDLCYYNFLCRYPVSLPLLGTIEDWGNFFSNIAYIFSGVVFILAVKYRSIRRRREMVRVYENNRNDGKRNNLNTIKLKDEKIKYYEDRNIKVEFLNRCGIPEQYGIFYAMGFATIIEGLLSACYHLCPTNESFQFDTTYMYILSILIFMKMYQFRHPDLTTNAYALISIVSLMLLLETASYYAPPRTYLYIFIVSYMFMMTIIASYLYYGLNRDISLSKAVKRSWQGVKKGKLFKKSGNDKTDSEETESKYSICSCLKQLKGYWEKGKKPRKIFFICMILGNIGFAIRHIRMAVLSKVGAISNVLLFIFSANMVGYALYYGIMKLYLGFKGKNKRHELISIRCWIYITLALVFGIMSAVIFVDKERTTKESPSVSRNRNADCQFLFFDKHDIWHFGSALSILFTMMALLTLDENCTDIDWEKLDVF